MIAKIEMTWQAVYMKYISSFPFAAQVNLNSQ